MSPTQRPEEEIALFQYPVHILPTPCIYCRGSRRPLHPAEWDGATPSRPSCVLEGFAVCLLTLCCFSILSSFAIHDFRFTISGLTLCTISTPCPYTPHSSYLLPGLTSPHPSRRAGRSHPLSLKNELKGLSLMGYGLCTISIPCPYTPHSSYLFLPCRLLRQREGR
jgi:hypothetical protein